MLNKVVAGFRQSSLLRTAADNLGMKIAAASMGLLNGILFARILGPAEFGMYSIVFAAVNVIAALAALGLPPLVTREIAIYQACGQWTLLKGLFVTSHRWVIFSSLLCMVTAISLELSEISAPTLSILGWVAALLLIPLTALNQLRAAILRGLHWVITADIPDLLLRPLILLIILSVAFFVGFQADSSDALLTHAVVVLFTLCVGSWFLTTRLPKQMRPVLAEFTFAHWLRGSLTFLTITIVGMLEGQVPLYLLGYLVGPKQAGIYQAANQIAAAVVMGLVAVNMPLQPKLASAWAKGDTIESQRLVTEAARWATGITIFAALLLIPFADIVMSLYGSQYDDAVIVLRILVLGQMINALSGACSLVLAMTGYQLLALYGLIAALTTTFIVAWLLIPASGVLGAAWANVAGLFTWNVLLIYMAWKKTSILTTIR